MTEVTIGGESYRLEKLTTFEQFHLSRKIAPLMPPLVPVFMQLDENVSVDKLMEVMAPLTEELANMDDKAAEYVMATALGAVRKQQGDKWMPVWNKDAKTLMFTDMDLGTAMELVYRVVADSLGPFIQGLLSKYGGSPDEAQQEEA